MGAVSDRLQISIEEARVFMRAEPNAVESSLIETLLSSAKDSADRFLNNDFRHVVEFIGRGDGSKTVYELSHSPAYNIHVTVNGEPVEATLNSPTGAVTLTEPPAVGAKVEADYETDGLPIPDNVRLWVLQKATRDYELRTLGVRQQQDSVGGISWGEVDMRLLSPYRINPGW